MKVLIFFNCHGVYINYWLIKSGLFLKEEIMKVPIQDLLSEEILPENIKQYAKKCDIMILQYIKKERGELNHTFLKILNKNAKCLIIPHYTSEIYHYEKLIKSPHYEEHHSLKQNYINKEKIESCINNVIEKDKHSDIKMTDFFKNNYDKYILFIDHAHPTGLFFYEMVRQISLILNIKNRKFNCDSHNKYFPIAQTNQDINVFLELENLVSSN